jgi:hypothetical protein
MPERDPRAEVGGVLQTRGTCLSVQVILRAIEDFVGQNGVRYDPRHRYGPDHGGEGDDRITSCLWSGPTVSEK